MGLCAEMNDGDKTCRFLQVWLTPDRRGHEPQYGSERYTREDRHNKLLHLLGGTGRVPDWPNLEAGKCIKLHQVSRAAWRPCSQVGCFTCKDRRRFNSWL